MSSIEEDARSEIAKEDHREAVDLLKVKIREKKTLRERLFPWVITIKRIN